MLYNSENNESAEQLMSNFMENQPENIKIGLKTGDLADNMKSESGSGSGFGKVFTQVENAVVHLDHKQALERLLSTQTEVNMIQKELMLNQQLLWERLDRVSIEMRESNNKIFHRVDECVSGIQKIAAKQYVNFMHLDNRLLNMVKGTKESIKSTETVAGPEPGSVQYFETGWFDSAPGSIKVVKDYRSTNHAPNPINTPKTYREPAVPRGLTARMGYLEVLTLINTILIGAVGVLVLVKW